MSHWYSNTTSSSSSSSSDAFGHSVSKGPHLNSPKPQRPWMAQRRKDPPSWLYPVTVLAVATIYMVLGALVLLFVENHQKQQMPSNCLDCTDVLLDTLWLNSQQMAEERWKLKAKKQLHLWVTTQQDSTTVGPRPRKMDIEGNWSFSDSLYCIFSVVTTIGWGNVAPESEAGRGFIVAFLWLGIPLALIVIGQLGSLLRNGCIFLWRQLVCLGESIAAFPGNCPRDTCLRSQYGRPCCVQCSQRANPLTDSGELESSDDNLPVIFLFVVLMVYFLVGAIFLQMAEGSWSLLDAIYYSHVSFSTIGFGDLVLNENASLVFFYLYMIVGIVLLAMCFQIVQDTLDDLLNQAVLAIYKVVCSSQVLVTSSDQPDGRGYATYKDKRASGKGMHKQRGLIINSV